MTYPTLLPSNSTPFERDMEQVMARAIHEIPVDFEKLWRIDECPIELLPWLAWALSTDYWNSDWSEEKKRAVVANSLYIHQHKGTIAAVKRALLLADAEDAQLSEWFEYEGKPKTFQIILPAGHPAIATQSKQKEMLRLVFDAKPIAAHLGFPDPTNPEIVIPGLKVTETLNLPEEIKLLLAGNVHDLRRPSYETQLQFKIPTVTQVVAFLRQTQPIPLQLILNHPTHLDGFAINKKWIAPRSRYVDVFKPLPEGDLTPGHVQITSETQYTTFLSYGSEGHLPTEHLDYEDLQFHIPMPTMEMMVVDDQSELAEIDCTLPALPTLNYWSGNTPFKRLPTRYVNVFKPVPEGEIGIGSVTVSFLGMIARKNDGYGYGQQSRPVSQGLLNQKTQGILFSMGNDLWQS